jgi:hypothetical protein
MAALTFMLVQWSEIKAKAKNKMLEVLSICIQDSEHFLNLQYLMEEIDWYIKVYLIKY